MSAPSILLTPAQATTLRARHAAPRPRWLRLLLSAGATHVLGVLTGFATAALPLAIAFSPFLGGAGFSA